MRCAIDPSVTQIDLSFSGMRLTGTTDTHVSWEDLPEQLDFSHAVPLRRLRIFCNDLPRDDLAPQCVEQLANLLRGLQIPALEELQFFLCREECIPVYQALQANTALFSTVKQVSLSLQCERRFWNSCDFGSLSLPLLPCAETLTLIPDPDFPLSCLQQLQAPRLRELKLLHTYDPEQLRLPSKQFPVLESVVLTCYTIFLAFRSPDSQKGIALSAAQFPASLKSLRIMVENCHLENTFSLEGGENLELLEVQGLQILQDSLRFAARLRQLAFDNITVLRLSELTCLERCVLSGCSIYRFPEQVNPMESILPANLAQLEAPSVPMDQLSRHMDGFDRFFSESSPGIFRRIPGKPFPVHSLPPEKSSPIHSKFTQVEIVMSLNNSGQASYCIFLSQMGTRTRLSALTATIQESSLHAITDLSLHIDLEESPLDKKRVPDFSGPLAQTLSHLLDWVDAHMTPTTLHLMYLPVPFFSEGQLRSFVPCFRQLLPWLQNSALLRNIETLYLKDYFDLYPSIFSLPNLKSLFLYWDYDVDWNVLKQWHLPNLESLLVDGAIHLHALSEITDAFPRLRNLTLRSQHPDDPYRRPPLYTDFLIPAQLTELSIDGAKISGLQPGEPSRLRTLCCSRCVFDPGLLPRIQELEHLTIDFYCDLTGEIPPLHPCQNLRELTLFEPLNHDSLSFLKGLTRLESLSLCLWHPDSSDPVGKELSFLFECSQLHTILLYDKDWCMEVLLEQRPDLLVEFSPYDTGCFYGLQRIRFLLDCPT